MKFINYLTASTPLPQYLPYARFLLDTDLRHTAKLLYTLLLDRATLFQKNNWINAQGRIYDRLLEMCIPISCIGGSFRKENAQEKLERLKLLIG